MIRISGSPAPARRNASLTRRIDGIVLRAGTWGQQDGYPLHGDEREGCAPQVCAVDNTTPWPSEDRLKPNVEASKLQRAGSTPGPIRSTSEIGCSKRR